MAINEEDVQIGSFFVKSGTPRYDYIVYRNNYVIFFKFQSSKSEVTLEKSAFREFIQDHNVLPEPKRHEVQQGGREQLFQDDVNLERSVQEFFREHRDFHSLLVRPFSIDGLLVIDAIRNGQAASLDFLLGALAFQDDLDTAIHDLEEAYKKSPAYITANLYLGAGYYRKGLYEKSAFHYEKALERCTDIRVKNNYACALLQLGIQEIEEAHLGRSEKYFSKAVDALEEIAEQEKDTDNDNNLLIGYLYLGIARYHLKGLLVADPEWQKATMLITKLKKESSLSASTYLNIGSVFCQIARANREKKQAINRIQEYLDVAKENYVQAIKKDPTLHGAHYHLGQILIELGDYKGAAHSFGKAVMAVGDEPGRLQKYWREVINACRHVGDYNVVELLWQLRGHEEERRCKEYIHAGKREFDSGYFDKAIEEFRRAIAIKKDDEETLYYLGRCYLKKGSYSLASDSFRNILRNNPRNFSTYEYLAEALWFQKQYGQALYVYDRSCEQAADEGDRRALGRYITIRNQWLEEYLCLILGEAYWEALKQSSPFSVSHLKTAERAYHWCISGDDYTIAAVALVLAIEGAFRDIVATPLYNEIGKMPWIPFRRRKGIERVRLDKLTLGDQVGFARLEFDVRGMESIPNVFRGRENFGKKFADIMERRERGRNILEMRNDIIHSRRPGVRMAWVKKKEIDWIRQTILAIDPNGKPTGMDNVFTLLIQFGGLVA